MHFSPFTRFRPKGMIYSCGLLAVLAGCGPGTKEIHLTGNDKMQYNLNEFEVKAGQQVMVSVENIGKLPKASMAHNFVLLQPGMDATEYSTAAAGAGDNDYIPAKFEDRVIARTKSHAGPGETVSVTFTAPKKPGDYDYLCSFPGHFFGGMKGKMHVVP